MSRSQRGWGAAGLSAAVLGILWSAAGANPNASLVGAKVDNFMLADQSGMGHELYYYTASPAIVLVSSADGDAVSARAAKALAKVRDAFKGKNVQFLMLDSSLNSPRGKFVGTPGSADLPVLQDELQLVGRALGVDDDGGSFPGRDQDLDARVSRPDRRFVRAEEEQESDAHRGAQCGARRQAGAGCRSGGEGHGGRLPGSPAGRASSRRSTTRRRSRRCSPKSASACHTQGGLGPFAMNSYDVVKGFAPMIREVLRTKRMPPYHSDSHGSIWTDDMRLTDAQVKTDRQLGRGRCAAR